MQGTVRKHDQKIRITAELIDTVNGQNLWAEHYDRELKDIFEVEDEVSTIIVSTLVSRIENSAYQRTQRRAPENLAAYEWVLQGNRNLDRGGKEDLFQARRMYKRAIELDPEYAAAYTGLSKSYQGEHWGLLAEDSTEVLSGELSTDKRPLHWTTMTAEPIMRLVTHTSAQADMSWQNFTSRKR